MTGVVWSTWKACLGATPQRGTSAAEQPADQTCDAPEDDAARAWFSKVPRETRAARRLQADGSHQPRPSLPKVFRIAVTGGPCAGKTSLVQRLLRDGLPNTTHTAAVPELATMVMQNGLRFGLCVTPRNERTLHGRFLGTLIAMEELMYGYMRENLTSGPAALLCDRGTLDASAYCAAGIWEHVLADRKLTHADLCENRYDCVVFMRSIAVDSPSGYSHDNNSARRETADQAAEVDERLLRVWSRHPRLIVVGNDYATFDEKLDDTVNKLNLFCRSQS